jgi:hypothetical protein
MKADSHINARLHPFPSSVRGCKKKREKEVEVWDLVF